MAEIVVVQTSQGLRGYGEENDRAWKRFKGWLKNLEPGEFFTLSYKKPRNLAFHRKYFAMLNHAFEHWEPEQGRKRLTYKGKPIEKSFESFREQVTILAGFYEQSFDLRGRMSLRAKSIAFDKMDDEEFEKVYEAVLRVLLEHVLHNYTRDDVERVVAELEKFGS